MSWIVVTQQQLRQFAEARSWQRFHTPRSLLLALVGEVGELAEHFQWRSDSELADDTSGDARDAEPMADEMADIAIYLLRLADVMKIDLEAAVTNKMARNEARFPADEWTGRANK